MIQALIERWEKNKPAIRAEFATRPESYEDLVRRVVKHLGDTDENWDSPDPDPARIHVIDDGHCQGALLFIIARKGYQPRTYYQVFVSYGSCGGCDTLEAIHGYGDEPPTEEQLGKYMTLALHIVQRMKEISADSFEDA